MYELTELIGQQHTDSALFWYHADLYPTTEEECAKLLVESNRCKHARTMQIHPAGDSRCQGTRPRPVWTGRCSMGSLDAAT